MSLIKLEAGKSYVSRNGRLFGPLVYGNTASDKYVFGLGGRHPCWMPDGTWFDGMVSADDLVAEAASAKVDPVNHPAHYTAGGIECIDAIQAAVGPEQFKGYLRGNVLKYLWRYEHKGGVESLRKAQWYLDRLVQANA